MANLKLRSTTSATDPGSTSAKGSALTHAEMDSNLILINNSKLDNVTDTFTGTLTVAGSGGSAVGALQLNDNDDSNSVTIKALGTIASSYTLTLPPDDGTSGQVLTTDGSGVLTFTDKTALTSLDIDSFTDGTGITVAATDQMLISDGGTEKRINASQIDTYVSGTTATLTNKTLTTPVLSGAITTASNGDITFDPNGTGDVLITPTTPSGQNGPGRQFGWNDHSGFTGSGATGGVAHINSVLSVAAGTNTPDTNLLFNEGIQITTTSAGDGADDFDFSWPTLAFKSNDKHGALTSPNTNRNSQDQAYGNVWFVKQNKDATNTSQIAVESNQILGGFFGAGSHDSSSLAPTSAAMFMRATEDFTVDGSGNPTANGSRMEFSATPNGATARVDCLDINGDSVVINEDSNDVDFRVESNGEANAFKVDAGTDTVSIETIILKLPNLPTSNPGVAGQVYRDGTDLKISTG